MNFLSKIKESLEKGSKRVSPAAEELAEQGKKIGGEALETTKEMLAKIGGKTSEVTSSVKIKFEMRNLQKDLDLESLTLGKIILNRYRNDNFDPNEESIQEQIKKMMELENQIQTKNQEYDQLRKKLSDDYVVNKLSDDLAASGAVIDLLVISEESNVVDKSVKEIVLPKEALISVIKRGDEIIIPDGNTKLQAGDQVTVIGKAEDVEKVAKRFQAG